MSIRSEIKEELFNSERLKEKEFIRIANKLGFRRTVNPYPFGTTEYWNCEREMGHEDDCSIGGFHDD